MQNLSYEFEITQLLSDGTLRLSDGDAEYDTLDNICKEEANKKDLIQKTLRALKDLFTFFGDGTAMLKIPAMGSKLWYVDEDSEIAEYCVSGYRWQTSPEQKFAIILESAQTGDAKKPIEIYTNEPWTPAFGTEADAEEYAAAHKGLTVNEYRLIKKVTACEQTKTAPRKMLFSATAEEFRQNFEKVIYTYTFVKKNPSDDNVSVDLMPHERRGCICTIECILYVNGKEADTDFVVITENTAMRTAHITNPTDGNTYEADIILTT